MDKILAFGILLVVLLTVFLLLNNVYFEMLVDMNNEVELQNRKSAKIKSILSIENDLKEKVAQKTNKMKKDKLFLSKNNSTSAASELQNYLKKLITTYSKSKISTIKPYPVTQHDEYSEVSLEIRVKGITHKELQNVLYRIETKSPVLLVKELDIKKTKLQYKPLIKKSGNSDHLESIFVISGFFQDASGWIHYGLLTNNQNLVFMKILISILSLGAIYWSYYMLTNSDNDYAITPENQLSFSQFESDLKPLEKINSYQGITNMPLFDEDREPDKKVVKTKKVVKAPVVDNLQVQALGIALSSDGIIAVIKDLKNGKILRLRINEEIYGWVLKGVSQEKFTFSKKGKEKTIIFKNDRG